VRHLQPPNSASTLGNTPQGVSWANITGTLGVSNRQAYNVGGGYAFALTDTGVVNGHLMAYVSTLGAGDYLYFRAADVSIIIDLEGVRAV